MWAAEVSQPVYHTFYEGTSVGVAIRLQGLGLGFRHALVSLACVGIDNDKAVERDVDGILHKVLLHADRRRDGRRISIGGVFLKLAEFCACEYPPRRQLLWKM